MLRSLALIGALPIVLLATPAPALTAKEKMETCKFGADDQKLSGAKRKTFLSRCMANEPGKRTSTRKPAAKPPAAQPASAPAAAPKQ